MWGQKGINESASKLQTTKGKVVFFSLLLLAVCFFPTPHSRFGPFKFGHFKEVWAKPQSAQNSHNDSEPTYDEAIALYYHGDLDACIEAFRRVVLNNPEDNEARMDLVILLREAGKLNEAYRHLDLLIRKYPRNPVYWREWIKTVYLSEKPDSMRFRKEMAAQTGESLYWEGLRLLALEQPDPMRAMEKLKSSVQSNPKNPLAHYALGRLYLTEKNYRAAENHLKETLKIDAYFNAALPPLAGAYLGQKKLTQAYNLLKRINILAPWDKYSAQEFQRLSAEHPSLKAEEARVKRDKIEVTSPPQVTPFNSKGAVIPEIRVGLAENVQDLQVKTGAPFTLLEPEGIKRISGSGETLLCFAYQNSQITVTKADGSIIVDSSPVLSLIYQDSTATTAIFDLQLGQGQYWAGEEDRFYRGEIRFVAGAKGITIINHLNLEEYLYSVLPAEMPASWPKEALRAQAIAARSYALANMGSYASRGFDVMGSVLSAAYKGVKSEHPASTSAVDLSRGQVITYNGKVIPAFFSANSGGYTESQKSVWGSENTYLKAVPDQLLSREKPFLSPYGLYTWLKERPRTYSSNSSSAYRWQVLVTREEIEARIGWREELGTITSITSAGRGISGRIEKIKITGTKGEYLLTGDLNIRNRLGGLRSTLFTVEPKIGRDGTLEYFLFTGGGWGHGVGLCQTGAAGMASAKFKAEEILTHYYSGVKIGKLY